MVLHKTPPEPTWNTKSIANLRNIINERKEQQQPKNDDAWTAPPPLLLYGWVEDAGNLYGSIESYTTIKSGLRQTVSPTLEDKEYKPSPLPDEWETHKDSYGTVVVTY